MATVSSNDVKKIVYPTSDGRPMAETDYHRDLMLDLIKMLKAWFAGQTRIYVSGNLLIFYVPGNKRKHVAPDVFVVIGTANHPRENYLLWEEGKGPDFIIELTSSSTRKEDIDKKFKLYRDVLKVKEYFLFDPKGDYLKPRLQGYRLENGEYVPIALVDGRMPSEVLGLHLEADGWVLRLYDPATGRWLPTPDEKIALEEKARHEEEKARHEEEKARRRAEAEVERLGRELEKLRQERKT